MRQNFLGMCVQILTLAGATALFLTLLAGTAIAGKQPADKPVTHYLTDYDPNFAAYTIQSDGGGAYINGVNGDLSILTANVLNGLTWGDRILENGTIRKLAITFSQQNAVQPGDPGYVVPANPPVWGTLYVGAKLMNKCTADGLSMYTMHAGDKIMCQMHARLHPLDATSNYYRLDMGTPGEDESQKVQISCNAHDSAGCTDWFIDPIPTVNPDGSTSPGKTRARLNYIVICHGNGCAPDPNRGAFYMTFHVHVTRP